MADEELTPQNLLGQGLAVLSDLLGSSWTVTPRPEREGSRGSDFIVEVRAEGDSSFTQLLVEVKTSVTPRMVQEVLVPKMDLLERVNHYTNLFVMAPWVSPRTQELLRKYGIGYLDLNGNVSLRVPKPAIVIHTEGATRAPRAHAQQQSKTTLGGAKAGRLVRILADVRPPYGATELARAAGMSLPYVSRLLDTLEDQLLVRRDGRAITDVDWPNLLRARAAQTNLLGRNSYAGMLAPNGVAAVMNQIRALPPVGFDGVVITGSWAAHRVAPLAVGGQLTLYVAARLNVDDLADDLGLLPVQENADVLLVQAPDLVVFERAATYQGLRYVALSQLVLDCLSGPGRMPAEGEAVLQYMTDHQETWRALSIHHAQENLQL
ncbi:helix-turn-helix domain-containing protein [Streptomyces sp. RKAG293]|uniref:helix-turn-helix domain-containing protein n=1 Tax=Streptomyces sp. RKAG293 TaxID=2893403 RepID=UPI002033DAC0|nr:helix-turn-helix domain-containing protein [Streptomyces sp. RKAG293]MCM2420222.1 helix-turn-helix domain-containing protein [Streptomyces sp. RKAG293]